MNEKEIFEKVVNLISPYVKNKATLENVSESTTILNDLGVNSSRQVDIILAIEDEFDIAIQDEEADNIKALGDIVALIALKNKELAK